MDMDLNDEIAVKNVMDRIVNHPFVMSFLLGSLIGTKYHRQTELLKKIFFYHDAWTPHDLWALVFGIDEGPHFLVNVFEPLPQPRHNIPFESYGKAINEEDIPVPPFQYLGIETFVRIDVFGNGRYKIRNGIMPKNSGADGRYYSIGNVDVDEMIASLHRRVEGYRIINELTNFHDVWDEDNEEENWEPYVDPNDTFENKILNVIYEHQKSNKHPGDLLELAKGLLTSVKVWQPYRGSGSHVLAVESPFDGTLFMVTFGLTFGKTTNEQKLDVKVNMRNLLAHYVPEYVSNQRHTTLMAISYDVTSNAEYDVVDTINSLMHSTESNEVKNAVKVFKTKVTLMHKCRQVIVRNMTVLGDKISGLPSTLQRLIYSSDSPIELIAYCMDVS